MLNVGFLCRHCSWLSDYDAAKPYLQQEQRYFDAATQQWSQQAHQLLQDMQQHHAAVQVLHPAVNSASWW
jgi:prefoldin subunit 5